MGGQGQAQKQSSTETDTLNTKVVPIVFVPGVMGSRIDITGAASDWDPDDTVEMAGWLGVTRRAVMKDLNISTGGTIMTEFTDDVFGMAPFEDITANERLNEIAKHNIKPAPNNRRKREIERTRMREFWEGRGFGQVVWKYYGALLMQLEEQLNPGSGGEVCPVHAVGYDWRQSNKDSALELDKAITRILREHPLARKVVLVTHSMGGLVARSLLAQRGESRVVGVLHCVIPADGAPVAYRRYLTGARKELDGGEKGFRSILGDNRLSYALTQSVLRGPTELLPTNTYGDVFLRATQLITNKDIPNIYEDYARHEPPGIVPREGEEEEDNFPDLVVTARDVKNLRARIAEAESFAKSIAGRAHTSTFLMVGTGHRTDVEFDWTRGAATPSGENMVDMVIKSDAGDATVPRVSADFPGITPIARDSFTAEHAECFKAEGFTPAVITRVKRLLARA